MKRFEGFTEQERVRQEMLNEQRQRQERIGRIRSRFQDRPVVCRLFGPTSHVLLEGVVVLRVTNDGQVEVRCHPLGFTPFLTCADVDFAYQHFYPLDEEQGANPDAPTSGLAVSH